MAIQITNLPVIMNIQGIVGDTLDNWSLVFKDSDGNPKDISTIDFWFIVKKSYSKPDTEAIITKLPADAVKSNSVDATVDTLAFPLTPSDTEVTSGKYVYAIKILDGTDERTYIDGGFVLQQRRIDTV